MFNSTTSILRATYQSQTSNNTYVDAKQDIYPADEETKQEMIRTAVLVNDKYEFDYSNRERAKLLLVKLMRCANCGFLSKGRSFIKLNNDDTFSPKCLLDGCPRCNSKAIFMDKEEEEKK